MDDPKSSPTWKKPSDIMKKHRKKKRIALQKTTEKTPDKLSAIFSPKNAFLQPNSKRRNPFSQPQESQTDSPSKRRKSEHTEMSPSSIDLQENVLFTFLGRTEEKEQENEGNQCSRSLQIERSTSNPSQNEPYSLDDDDSKSQFDFIEKFFKEKQKAQSSQKCIELQEEVKQDIIRNEIIPVDWSLKVKLRVISEKPLLWCTQLRTVDEARGISQFLTGTPTTQVAVQESERKAYFQESGLYWIYPSLPWMKLFPRIVPDAKLRTASIGLDNVVQTALQSDWTESFTSVFHQLRAQHCPYFYVCTHQFSVLFRASTIAGQTTLSALLSPTTRGMRESLKGEDISFTMPLLDRRRSSINPDTESESQQEPGHQKHAQPYQHVDDDDDDMIDTDEGASVWLESIGLDKKQFPSLEPNKVKIQREGFKMIDNRPESTVCVTGPDVQGLYNYLLNCRSCVAISGPQAGLPPTILAPTSFKGATLKSHKVKHSLVKQMDNNKQIKSVHILEILGPVLPHHISSYNSLFRDTQEGCFSLTFNTHEPSISFNAVVGSEDDQSNNASIREQFVMRHKKFDPFFSNRPLDTRLTCIREIHCKGGYSSFLV
ncbi:protein downstream neighbor of son homolog [Pecten maximus]|uniref:protein downstream neighbor of son homolog n=1 Tax=Pecten maximus TaxID=6579 RepID=UPI001458E76E|nr:protein downstream neighbor of son homolog [Pecten maximus]